MSTETLQLGVVSVTSAGCECGDDCGLAFLVSEIAHRSDVARNLLGDTLDFLSAPYSISELKNHIARAMRGVPVHEVEEILNKVSILPKPSSFTLAGTAHGYAIIFVVGNAHTTHPVVVTTYEEG